MSVLSLEEAQVAGNEVLERSLSACSLQECCDRALAAEGGEVEISKEEAQAWASVPPPSPVPFKAQITLHSIEDMASLGSNSTAPTTLGWLWSQAAAAAAATRLTSAPGAPSTAAEPAACTEAATPTPPPNTAMQPTSAMHLPAMLGPHGRFASFGNAQGFRIAAYFWPATGCCLPSTSQPTPLSDQPDLPLKQAPPPSATPTNTIAPLTPVSSSLSASFQDAGAPFLPAPSIPPAPSPNLQLAQAPLPSAPLAHTTSTQAPYTSPAANGPSVFALSAAPSSHTQAVVDPEQELIGAAVQRAPSPFALVAEQQALRRRQQEQQQGQEQQGQEQQKQQGGQCKGVVVLFHGHGSHVGYDFLNIMQPGTAPRYEGSWVQALNDAGFSVAAMDHQGMGRSEGHRWYVHAFQHYVDDAGAFVAAVHDGVSEVPGFPPCQPFLIATSLGGCIATHVMKQLEAAAEANGERESYLSGAVLLAPMLSLQAVASSPTNQTLLKIAHLLNMVVPGAAIVGGGASNPDILMQETWERDPLTSQKHKTCVRNALEYVRACSLLALEAASGQADVMEVKEVRNCCWRLPLLLFHAERDSWTDCLGSIQLYRSSASLDKTLRLLDGHAHLLTRGEEGKCVLEETLAWLVKHVPITQE